MGWVGLVKKKKSQTITELGAMLSGMMHTVLLCDMGLNVNGMHMDYVLISLFIHSEWLHPDLHFKKPPKAKTAERNETSSAGSASAEKSEGSGVQPVVEKEKEKEEEEEEEPEPETDVLMSFHARFVLLL